METKIFLGIDIGSSSSKAVLINDKKEIISSVVINVGTGSSGPKKAVEEACRKAEVTEKDVTKTVVTGYGRMIYEGADKQITEISCHAKGAAYLYPQVRTIIDIGGQDAKIIRINSDGVIENFLMNDKCAAGTGRFLEVAARVLDCEIDFLSEMAANGNEPVQISNTCAVFAESEMISQLAAGKQPNDVAWGIHKSVAKRIAGLGARIGIIPDVVMTGGVALNDNLVECIEAEVGSPIKRLDNPQIAGALGAALYAYDLDNK